MTCSFLNHWQFAMFLPLMYLPILSHQYTNYNLCLWNIKKKNITTKKSERFGWESMRIYSPKNQQDNGQKQPFEDVSQSPIEKGWMFHYHVSFPGCTSLDQPTTTKAGSWRFFSQIDGANDPLQNILRTKISVSYGCHRVTCRNKKVTSLSTW